jgi:hypothetical protein
VLVIYWKPVKVSVGRNENLNHDLWSFLVSGGWRFNVHEQCLQDQPSRMVCFITLISLTRQGWAWPHEMTRTFIIAIAAVLYVLAAGHAHHPIVNDATASLKGTIGQEANVGTRRP